MAMIAKKIEINLVEKQLSKIGWKKLEAYVYSNGYKKITINRKKDLNRFVLSCILIEARKLNKEKLWQERKNRTYSSMEHSRKDSIFTESTLEDQIVIFWVIMVIYFLPQAGYRIR